MDPYLAPMTVEPAETFIKATVRCLLELVVLMLFLGNIAVWLAVMASSG